MAKKVVLAAIVILAVGIGAYYVMSQRSQDTSGWRTYKNTEYGFEFSYPNDFKLNKNSTHTEVTVYPLPQPIEFGPSFQFRVQPAAAKFSPTPGVISSESVWINGSEWLMEYGVGDTVPQKFWHWSIVIGDKRYTMLHNSEDPDFMKIVSTARLDAAEAIQEFKAYSDDQIGLSFEYPATWQAPTRSMLSTRTTVDLGHGLSIVSGIYYNQDLGRGMTIDELTSTLPTAATKESIIVDGKQALRISYVALTGSAVDSVYIPGEKQGSIIVLYSQGADNVAFKRILATLKVR